MKAFYIHIRVIHRVIMMSFSVLSLKWGSYVYMQSSPATWLKAFLKSDCRGFSKLVKCTCEIILFSSVLWFQNPLRSMNRHPSLPICSLNIKSFVANSPKSLTISFISISSPDDVLYSSIATCLHVYMEE